MIRGTVAGGFYAADHRSAAAEGNDGDAAAGRLDQDGGYLLFRLGPDDGIGGMGHLAAADAHRIAIALAQAVDGPLGGVGGDGVLADGAAQSGQRSHLRGERAAG